MCKEQGHSPDDPKCRFYEPQQHVIAFIGEDNVLSDFYHARWIFTGYVKNRFSVLSNMLRECGAVTLMQSKPSKQQIMFFLPKYLGTRSRSKSSCSVHDKNVMIEVIENKCSSSAGLGKIKNSKKEYGICKIGFQW